MGAGKPKNRRPQNGANGHPNGRSRPAGGKSPAGQPIRFVIPSDFAQSRNVQERILQDVTRCGYDEQSQFAIKLALEEAMINAIKHGNKLDPAKKVHIEARVQPKKTTIVIEDEGPGFTRDAVPDPRADENLCKCSGRGILLIEAYMNSVTWTKHGRRVRMIRLNKPRRHSQG
jgi:serine/threonine-protein kinase RsbW